MGGEEESFVYKYVSFVYESVFFFAPARLDIMLGLKRRDLESKRKRGGEVSFVYEHISLEYE